MSLGDPLGATTFLSPTKTRLAAPLGSLTRGVGTANTLRSPQCFFCRFFFVFSTLANFAVFLRLFFFCRVYRGSMSPSRLRTAGFRRCSSQEGREAGSLCVSGDGPPPDPAGSGGRHPRRGRRHPGAHCRGGLPAGGGGRHTPSISPLVCSPPSAWWQKLRKKSLKTLESLKKDRSLLSISIKRSFHCAKKP